MGVDSYMHMHMCMCMCVYAEYMHMHMHRHGDFLHRSQKPACRATAS